MGRRTLALVLVAAGFGLAHAGHARADVFRACGYGGLSTGSGTPSCTSLPDAIAAATATNGRDTIELFPGLYCPIEIAGNVYSGIDFVGMGWGGFALGSSPVSLNGFEAGTAAFKWSSTYCGSSVPSALVSVHAFISDRFSFRNLTIDGSDPDGPATGLSSPGDQPMDLVLRDVIVENARGAGVDYVSGPDSFSSGNSSLDIENSAIVDNKVGVQTSGYASIVSSTIYGSGTYGVVPNGKMSLIDDTITGNTYGLGSLNSGSSQFQAVNTLLARNTLQDCYQPIAWNTGLTSSHNLVGDTLCGAANGAYTQLDASATIGAPVTSGLTPWIQPPAQAAGAAQCNLAATDQREYVSPTDSCYAGSVQPGGNGTPVLDSPSLDLGQVDVGAPAAGSVSVGFSGGGTVDVQSVALNGAGWSLTSDGCTYAVLVQDTGLSSCALSVSLTPSTTGTWSGSITVDTLAGTVTIPLTADAVVRPTGAGDAYDVTGGSLAVDSPGVLANDASGTTVSGVAQTPGHGTLTGPNADGSFSYTADDGYTGYDSFEYTIADADGVQSHPITVTLHVTAVQVQPGSGNALYVDAAWAGLEPGLDPDGSGPATAMGTDAFGTIADALAAAGPGATIHVAAGTYDETGAGDLAVDQAGVELLGAGAGSTHVTTAGLRLEASDAVVDGLDLHGTGTWSGGAFTGPSAGVVEVAGGTGSIVRNCTLSDAQYGVHAVSALTEAGPEDSSGIEVDDDDISHVVVGVDLVNVTNATIEGNAIHDTGNTTKGGTGHPQAAIVVEQANDSIPAGGNTISSNTIDTPVNHGIAVHTSGNTIDANTITGAGSGYPAFAASAGIEVQGPANVVSDNSITGSAFAGIRILAGADATSVSGNAVTGTLHGGADDGYSGANAGGSAIVIEGASGTTISGNTLSGNAGWGISQADATTGGGTGSPGTTATGNDIAGNTAGGVDNLDAQTMDATGNWWGDASGPGGDGPGSGDAVSGASFEPWLACPFEDAPCTAPTNQPPVASFTATVNGLGASFDASASADPDPGGMVVSYAWNFGDGTTSSAASASATHTYAAGGTYTVTLTVTDDAGATGSTSRTVVTAAAPSNAPPTAAFTATTNGLTASFDGSASIDRDGTIVSYAWDFGDGTTSSVASSSAAHSYAAAGTYTVTLTVTDNGGATATKTGAVVATAPPATDAAPTATFLSDGVGLSISFNAGASRDPDGTITSYTWNFGDGITGAGATPSHTYSAAGTYTVKLTVTDDQGAPDTVTHDVTVGRVQADISLVSSIGLTVKVAASTPTDPNGTGFYYWDFGDGAEELWSAATTSYAYAAPGTYTVTLAVANDTGNDVVGRTTLVVPHLSTVAGDRSPTADFVSATNGISASFTGSSSSDPDGSVASYEWDFGDGSTATGIDVAHVYRAAGTYSVGLLVTDDKGATATVVHTVSVQAILGIATLRFSSYAAGLSALFDASDSTDGDNTIVAYTWDFGDGSTGSGRVAPHQYAHAGTYAVTLTVTSDEGGNFGQFRGSVVQSVTLPKPAPRTGGLIWTPAQLPAPPHHIAALACAADGHCVATGRNDNFDDATWATTAAAGGVWTTFSSIGGNTPNLVQCVSTSVCVGFTDDAIFSANPWAGERWTSTGASGGAQAFLYGAAKAMSCASPSLCIIVGGTGLGSTECSACTGGVEAGGDFAISTDPTSANWTASWFHPQEATVLSSISCPSTSLCAVVDNGQIFTSPTPRGSLVPAVPTWFASGVQGVAKVSCPTTALCVGLDTGGGLLTSTNPIGGASAWKSTSIGLTDVGCASASFCVGGDSHGRVYTSTLPTGGASMWSAGPDLGSGSIGPIACRPDGPSDAGPQIYCTLVVQDDSSVSGVWVGRQPTVTVGANGPGTVTSATAGIDCGQTCAHSYFLGDQVTLTAAPDSGSSFRGWSGDCTGTSRTCTLTVGRDMTVGASFAPTATATTPIPATTSPGATAAVTIAVHASFTAAASSTPGSLSATFDGSASTGPVTSYSWDFGDGTTGSGKTTAHTFPRAGTYTVTLTVAEAGSTDTTSHAITVPSEAASTTTRAATPGTLSTGDDSSAPTVRWSARTFPQPVTVTLVSQPSTFLGGRERGVPAIQLLVTTAEGAAVTRFAAPLELTFPPDSRGTVPAYSINGKQWTSMPQLSGTTLPPGFKDGWYRDSGGVVHVLTLHATYFGLLASRADAHAELVATVRVARVVSRIARVRVGSTLPATATVVVRARSRVVTRVTHAVRRMRVFSLGVPARLRASTGTVTVTVRAGGFRSVKTVRVRFRR